jgi:2-phospho-L-lactate guanylyltransferase
MSLHIFIPCKALAESKSRLAPVLDAQARITLSLSLLERSLELAASLAPKSMCHLLTNDPHTQLLGQKIGVQTIAGANPGLNRALFHARSALLSEHRHFELLVLPIDLPYATADALEDLIASGSGVAIAPDRDMLGTNALYLGADASRDFPFRFGEKSFDVHCNAAHSLKRTLSIQLSRALSFDLDTPEHFEEMREVGSVFYEINTLVEICSNNFTSLGQGD